MNDRKKILDLVQQGKLTPEQADILLDALTKRKQEKTKGNKPWDVRSLSDLKQFGTQLSNTVSQSLADVRKSVETELKALSNLGSTQSLSASTEVDLPATVTDVWVETKNGQIQVHAWDEDFFRIRIRGQVRCSELSAAEQQLGDSLQATETTSRYHLTILHDAKDGVLGASVDINVPRSVESIAVQTVNGEIRLDGVTANKDIRAETTNGNLWLSNCHAVSMNLASDNGGIDIHQSLYAGTQNVYASTRNGTIVLEGIDSEARVTGVLKTAVGGIDVSNASLQLEYIDASKKMHARLYSEESTGLPVHIHCETRNGSIYVR